MAAEKNFLCSMPMNKCGIMVLSAEKTTDSIYIGLTITQLPDLL